VLAPPPICSSRRKWEGAGIALELIELAHPLSITGSALVNRTSL